MPLKLEIMIEKININKKILWFLFFSLMLLKYGYYGFKYYPVIDDWIQYGGYRLYDNIFHEVVIAMRLYTTRPIANISDVYILAPFWPNMQMPFLIITAMHGISAYFLCEILEKNKMPVSIEFLLIFGLLPLGTEATYWISASARIVVGMFFMILSLYILNLYLETEKKSYAFTFFILNLISMGYYEEIIVFSFLCPIALIFINREKLKHKWIAGLSFINFAFIAIYYKSLSHIGNASVRGELVKGNFIKHFILVLKEVTKVFTKTHFPIYTNGFINGLRTLKANRSYMFLGLLIIFSIAVGLWVFFNSLSNNRKGKNIRLDVYKILLGFILFWMGFGANFLLQVIWICNRNTFTSFIGLALVVEGIFNIIFRGKIGAYFRSVVIFALTFIFLVVNVSEITQYKNVSETDKIISENIIANIKDDTFFDGNKKVIVFNAESSYVEQNSYYNDHIHNITSSDWALTGGLRAVATNPKIQYLLPVPENKKTLIEKDIWDTSIIMGIHDDLSVIDLKPVKLKDGSVQLFEINGKLFGTAYRQEDETHANYLYNFAKQ